MREHLAAKLTAHHLHAQIIDTTAESLPLPDASVDHVISTLVLCTVDDPAQALAEIRRVLKPHGSLRFIEHVRGRGLAARIQDLVTPLIRHLGAGCHPNRDTAKAIRAAGFDIGHLETFTPRPRIRFLAPFIQGIATPPNPQWQREQRWLSNQTPQ
jgi:ubiquinone/menaquinone biosynthesis C-methylase UbiE